MLTQEKKAVAQKKADKFEASLTTLTTAQLEKKAKKLNKKILRIAKKEQQKMRGLESAIQKQERKLDAALVAQASAEKRVQKASILLEELKGMQTPGHTSGFTAKAAKQNGKLEQVKAALAVPSPE